MSSVLKYTGFRLMGEADVATIFAIDEQIYPFPWSEPIFSDCIKAGHLCLVYEIQEQLVAYGVAGLFTDEAHILNLSVAGQYQGKGFGRMMLRKMIELVEEAGAKKVILEVRESNQVARQLYKTEDFKEIGLRKGYYPDESGREDAIVLEKICAKNTDSD